MRWQWTAALLFLGFCFESAHADDLRMGIHHSDPFRLNESTSSHPPYRTGAAYGPDGNRVQIIRSLSEHRQAQGYGREVGRLNRDGARLGTRLASLALLAQFGSPDLHNLGMLLASSDQMATVAGVNVLMRRINQEPIRPVAGTIAFDGHIHSGRSHDGGDSYESLILSAADKGLGAIAITDHNEFDYRGIRQVLESLKAEGRVPSDFLVVPGSEISTLDGHVLAYFITSRIQPGMSAAETIRAIHAQGGLAVAAHPAAKGGVGLEAAARLPFDGVEVRNGATLFPMDLLRELAHVERDWGGRFQLASSDSHGADGVGMFYTRVVVDEVSLEGLEAGLRRSHADHQAVADNQAFSRYERVVRSPAVHAAFFPLITYLDFKEHWLERLAERLLVDRIQVMPSWEFAILRMANLVYLPEEALRLARGDSELQRPLALRSLSISKGPVQFAYEPAALFASSMHSLSETDYRPTWKVQGVVEF